MRFVIVCFSDELSASNSLLRQITAENDGDSAELWVLGGISDIKEAGKLNFRNITEIIPTSQEHLRYPDSCADAVYECLSAGPADVIIFPSGVRGNDLAARVAVLTGAACALGAAGLCREGGGVIIKKTVYSGNLRASLLFERLPLVLSMEPAADDIGTDSAGTPELIRFEAKTEQPAWLSDFEFESAETGDLLKKAELVIVAGRGVGKAENFWKLEELAEAMGGVLGGTRPAVYDGRLPRERMIGSSAAVLSPRCCVVFGASGAKPFLTGVDKSGLLIAVNRDPNALIFECCDVGVVADCNEFAEELLRRYRND
ncbi:MAG: electron transfer flavoprotein subunit alpha/FixB family protein [Oscillospiraceae bacterium]|nr:electron transfer flavoprotein subunit alpha/FixB family protein [Oscillospiraceae bacterium]